MKENDVVEYVGCSEEQINWGSNDDPRSILIIGREYVIEKVDVHSQHTKIKLYNKMGWFNSVCFSLKEDRVNSSLDCVEKMDPTSIQLDNTAKMFEYEKLSREIEECNDIDTLKNMLRCYIKLHMKHQEVSSQLLKLK